MYLAAPRAWIVSMNPLIQKPHHRHWGQSPMYSGSAYANTHGRHPGLIIGVHLQVQPHIKWISVMTAMTCRTTMAVVEEVRRVQGPRSGAGESRAGLWTKEEDAGMCKEGGRVWVRWWDDEWAMDIQRWQQGQHFFGWQHYSHACNRWHQHDDDVSTDRPAAATPTQNQHGLVSHILGSPSALTLKCPPFSTWGNMILKFVSLPNAAFTA